MRSAPPYLDIAPLDTRVQMLPGVAIVTFHLNDPDSFGRRTAVFVKEGKVWRIVHLHSSNVPLEP